MPTLALIVPFSFPLLTGGIYLATTNIANSAVLGAVISGCFSLLSVALTVYLTRKDRNRKK